jgi:pathogen-inducible salicylic acid glucosyltransferase
VKLPVDKVLAAELPGLPKGLQLEPADCSSFLTQQDSTSTSSTYLDLLLQQCQGLEVADHVLINSFYELQTEVRSFVYIIRVLDFWSLFI